MGFCPEGMVAMHFANDTVDMRVCICPQSWYGKSIPWVTRNETIYGDPDQVLMMSTHCRECRDRDDNTGSLIIRVGKDGNWPYPFPERNSTDDDCRYFRGCR